MKELNDILKELRVKQIHGDGDKIITGITADSREVKPGYLFIAVSGTKIDGHEFIGKAVEAGAAAVICENLPEDFSGSQPAGTGEGTGPSGKEGRPGKVSGSARGGVTMIVVEDSAAATGMAASAFHDHPSRKLRLTGVTGTNGKTTIATLLYNMFDALGYKCGLLSTVCNYVFRTRRDATHTTPDPVKLNALLAEMVDQG